MTFHVKKRPTRISVFLMALLVCLAVTDVYASEKSLPAFSMAYVFTTHHNPLFAAAITGEAAKASGYYLAPVVPREKYRLMDRDGRPLAVINLLVSKSGSETTTLFAMKRVDLALSSSTAFMSAIDKGIGIKILCPLHVDGMGMVFPYGSQVQGFDAVAAAVKASNTPFTIGYHSPTSAPRIVFEGALHAAGFKITDNPNDASADILMVDLKTTANLIPALLSKQVDCWVGPSPHPEVAESKKVGHIALDSRDLPPAGHWCDFPCCVLGASDDVIANHPSVAKAVTGLMAWAAAWCNEHKAETATIASQWIGIAPEAVEKSSIVYTTAPTANWLKGEGAFLAMLNSMGKLNGALKGATIESASPLLFDFSFITTPNGK
ncbi:hypothetical protein JCM14469_13010 [Desulfatiferula olefinivorans]